MPFATLQSISKANLERQCAASSGNGRKANWITSALSPALRGCAAAKRTSISLVQSYMHQIAMYLQQGQQPCKGRTGIFGRVWARLACLYSNKTAAWDMGRTVSVTGHFDSVLREDAE